MPIYSSAKLSKVIATVVAGVITLAASGAGVGFVIKDWAGSQKFVFSGSGGHLSITGSLTSGLITSCDSVDTTSTGTLVCGTDGGATALSSTGALQSFFDNRYVLEQGDTMSGTLTITGGLTLTQGANLTLTGAVVSATGSTRRYVVLHSGSGTTAATGTNVLGGLQSPFAGSIAQVKCYVGEVGSNGLTSFDVTAGGTSVTSTSCTVDATEVSSITAVTPPVVDTGNNSLTEGELIKVDMNSPSTTSPITFAVELTIDVTNFP